MTVTAHYCSPPSPAVGSNCIEISLYSTDIQQSSGVAVVTPLADTEAESLAPLLTDWS